MNRTQEDIGTGDAELIAAFKAGKESAFNQLVLRHQDAVYDLCCRILGRDDDAEDVAQECFVKAYKALKSFRGDAALSTWLYRIAVNACLNHRALRRPPTQELPEALPDPGRGAEARVLHDDEAERVRSAISRLPDKQRATLILKMYHELRHEEVAEILGTSVGTVKSNLFHALANLRRQLGERGGAES